MKRKDATIHAPVARAVIALTRAPLETMQVTEQNFLDALRDPNNVHICPLCHDALRSEQFKAHAPQCIKLHAAALERNREQPLGRDWKSRVRRLWLPSW